MTVKDGIYIDLPFDEYLAIDATSSSQIKAASVSAEKWLYQQQYNFKSTPAQALGSAIDCLITEGHDAFVEQYDDGSQPDDVEYLSDVAQIKGALKARDLKTTGKKADLAQRLFDDGFDGVVKGVNDEQGDRVKLTKAQAATVEECNQAMLSAGLVSEYFRGGYGQVSIVWTDASGERFKVRFDYLKNGAVYDLKTTSGKPDKSIMECAISDLVNYRYDIQAVLYMRGLVAAKGMPIIWRGKKGIASLLRHHLKSCGVFEFVFQRTVAPYDNGTFLFSQYSTVTGEENEYFAKTERDMTKAIERINETKLDNICGIKRGPVRAELTDGNMPAWFVNS